MCFFVLFLTLFFFLAICRVGRVMVLQLSSTSWHRALQFRGSSGSLTPSRWQIYCSPFFPHLTKRCCLCLGHWNNHNCKWIAVNQFVFLQSFNFLHDMPSDKYLIINSLVIDFCLPPPGLCAATSEEGLSQQWCQRFHRFKHLLWGWLQQYRGG